MIAALERLLTSKIKMDLSNLTLMFAVSVTKLQPVLLHMQRKSLWLERANKERERRYMIDDLFVNSHGEKTELKI